MADDMLSAVLEIAIAGVVRWAIIAAFATFAVGVLVGWIVWG